MPSSDVYSAFKTGIIYATQVGGASENVVSGYDAIIKYSSSPVKHNLSQDNHSVVKINVWEKLPADLQHPVYDKNLSLQKKETLGIRLGVGEWLK